MAKGKDGCVQPSRGPILEESKDETQGASPAREVKKLAEMSQEERVKATAK